MSEPSGLEGDPFFGRRVLGAVDLKGAGFVGRFDFDDKVGQLQRVVALVSFVDGVEMIHSAGLWGAVGDDVGRDAGVALLPHR